MGERLLRTKIIHSSQHVRRSNGKISVEKSIFMVSWQKPYTRTDYTFKLVGSGFSRKCSMERQKMMFEVRACGIFPTLYSSPSPFQKLSFLPLNGKVDVHNYQHIFHILEDYGDSPNTAPLEPIRIFFGRLIGRGQRDLILRYSVKNRHFIGSTSMDAQLAFIMANQAKVC